MKKFFSVFLTLFILCLFSVELFKQDVRAQDTGVVCEGITFDTVLNNELLEPLYQTGHGYVLPSGNYYLNADVKIMNYITVSENQTVRINLNGYVLDMNSQSFFNYGTLTIYDGNSSKANYYNLNTNGYETFRYNPDVTSGVDFASLNTDMIKNKTATCVKIPGGAIINGSAGINNYSTLNVYGGNLINNNFALYNSGVCDWDNGVLVTHAAANLYKGKMIGNYNSGNGAAMYINNGVVNMYEGFECSFNTSMAGSAAYTNNIFEDYGTLNMYGGVMKYNEGYSGAAVNCAEGTFNMYGGVICNNTGEESSAVSNECGRSCFNMYGGTIENNIGGPAVYNLTGVIRLGGKSVIQNNFNASGKARNLYTCVPVTIAENDKVHGLQSGSSIGVGTDTCFAESIPFVFTNKNTENYIQYFTSDDSDFYIKSNDASGKTKLSLIAVEITQQPSVSNDYTVNAKAAQGKTITYEWYRRLYTLISNNVEMSEGSRTDDKITSEFCFSSEHAVGFYFDGYDYVEFDYSGTQELTSNWSIVSLINDNGHYTAKTPYDQFGLYAENGFTIENVKLVKEIKENEETAAKLGGSSLTGDAYLCYGVVDDKYRAASKTVTPHAFTFDDETGALGSDPATIYQLTGRTFTLPANPYTKTGCTFVGWYDGSVLYQPDEVITVKDSDIHYTAEWSDKLHISVDATAQKYDYDGTAKPFVLKGVQNGISDITVEYYVDGSWTAEAPIGAGEYDVRVQRSEQTNYYALNKTIEKGLSIRALLQDINGKTVDNGGKGEYIQGDTFDLDAHITGLNLSDVKENSGSADTNFICLTVYRDSNNDGVCQENEKLIYGMDYTLEEGSIRVKLKKSYLDTLTVGEYVVDVDITTKNETLFNFEIPITILPPKTTPDTGENLVLSRTMQLMSICSAAALAVLYLKRKEIEQ